MSTLRDVLQPYFEKLAEKFVEENDRAPSVEESTQLWQQAREQWNTAMQASADARRDAPPAKEG